MIKLDELYNNSDMALRPRESEKPFLLKKPIYDHFFRKVFELNFPPRVAGQEVITVILQNSLSSTKCAIFRFTKPNSDKNFSHLPYFYHDFQGLNPFFVQKCLLMIAV